MGQLRSVRRPPGGPLVTAAVMRRAPSAHHPVRSRKPVRLPLVRPPNGRQHPRAGTPALKRRSGAQVLPGRGPVFARMGHPRPVPPGHRLFATFYVVALLSSQGKARKRPRGRTRPVSGATRPRPGRTGKASTPRARQGRNAYAFTGMAGNAGQSGQGISSTASRNTRTPCLVRAMQVPSGRKP